MLTVGELKEKLNEFPDMYKVVLCGDRGEEWAILPDLTGDVIGLAFMRVGLVADVDDPFEAEGGPR